MDEFFKVTGTVIFVDQPKLELVKPGDLPE
jgi:hypothetical protein